MSTNRCSPNGDDGGAFEAGRDFTQLQWSVEDLCEDGGQLVSTGFQTGWCHTVWAWCLSCSFWRPGAHHLHWYGVQVWGRWGLLEVLMVFFQTCNRTHSDRLPVVDSPQCWGMVSCSWCLSDLSTLKPCHWKRTGSLAYRNNSSLKVKVTWHTAKYGDPYSEFVLCILTHPKCTHSSEHTHTHTMN